MRSVNRYAVLLLAGSRRRGDPISTACRTRYKALAPVAGLPMILHPLRTLMNCEEITEIIIASQEPHVLQQVVDEYGIDATVRFHKSGDSIAETVLSVYREIMPGLPLLVTTADNCLLDTDHLQDFMSKAAAEPADVVVGFSQKDALLATCPDARRTWIRFSDTALTGCNLYLLKNPPAAMAVGFWKEFESSPKKVLRIARALGPGFFWRYWRHKLTVDFSFERLSQMTGVRVRPVYMAAPDVAIDADKLIDIQQIERILSRREARTGPAPVSGRPQRLVIFDLDRTITTFGTYTPFLLYHALRRNPFALLFTPVIVAGMLAYVLRWIGRRELKTLMFSLLAGRPPITALQDSCSGFVDRTLRRHVYIEALQSIRRWREQGAVLVLATASYDWMAGIFARRLGFDHVVATGSLQREGCVIPGMNGENCYGLYKYAQLTDLFGPLPALRAAGWRVWFYTDHHSDIPLLEQVDCPVAINPTRRLRKWAESAPGAVVLEWRTRSGEVSAPGRLPTPAAPDIADSRRT